MAREAMCDEYDDERMRAFWRQLATLQELEVLDSEADPVRESLEKPLGEIVEPKRAKPRGLLH